MLYDKNHLNCQEAHVFIKKTEKPGLLEPGFSIVDFGDSVH